MTDASSLDDRAVADSIPVLAVAVLMVENDALLDRAEKAEAEVERLAKDAARLDWLQSVKLANFRPLNQHLEIAAVELFTVQSQRVRGGTVRDAIDAAIDHAALAASRP